MAKTRPAPGPDGSRRPLWFDRPLRPVAAAYKVSLRMSAMSLRERPRAGLGDLGLLAAFGAVQADRLDARRHAVHAARCARPGRSRLDRHARARAALATRRIDWLVRSAHARRTRRTAPRSSEIEQLQTQNAMLEIVARSVDVPLAFQALASRIARLVPCDRVGPGAAHRGRRGVPDLHRARAERRAAARGRARRSCSRSSERDRQRRALARAADRRRHRMPRRRTSSTRTSSSHAGLSARR